jgi:hypothetical protein
MTISHDYRALKRKKHSAVTYCAIIVRYETPWYYIGWHRCGRTCQTQLIGLITLRVWNTPLGGGGILPVHPEYQPNGGLKPLGLDRQVGVIGFSLPRWDTHDTYGWCTQNFLCLKFWKLCERCVKHIHSEFENPANNNWKRSGKWSQTVSLVKLGFVHEVKGGLSGKSLQLLHRAIDPSKLRHGSWPLSPTTLSFKLDHNRD